VRPVIAVYAIRNTVNGRCYIGATRDLRTRLMGHRADLRRGACQWTDLQADWDRDGAEAFTFDTLETFTRLHGVREREDYWIAEAARTGGIYNRCSRSSFHCKWFGVEPGKEWQSAAATTAGKTEAA
jgi:group I intron endonuclease